MKKYKVFAVLFAFALFISGCSDMFGEQGIIVTPYDRQRVSGIQTILIQPPDNIIVDEIEIYIDNVFETLLFSPPYQYEWDTRQHPNGEVEIRVVIYTLMDETIEESITVLVENN